MQDEDVNLEREAALTVAEVAGLFEVALEHAEGIRARMRDLGYSEEDATAIAAAQMRVFLAGMQGALVAMAMPDPT